MFNACQYHYILVNPRFFCFSKFNNSHMSSLMPLTLYWICIISIIILIQTAFIPSLYLPVITLFRIIKIIIVIIIARNANNCRVEQTDAATSVVSRQKWRRDATSLKVNSVKYTAGYPGLRGDLTVARRWKPLSVGNKRFTTRNFELLLHLFAKALATSSAIYNNIRLLTRVCVFHLSGAVRKGSSRD